MHELSIAVSIVEMAQQEVAERGVRLSAVHLKLGALTGIVKDSLIASYEMACFDTPLQGSRLVMEDVPIVVFCPACQQQRTLPTMQSFACPERGTPTPEVLQGRELVVVGLEVVDLVGSVE